ncbi:hypothetical protein [Microbacterium sp. SLBN-146]|uniref:hypothetical protein n=1 Tax=Microbacterium sp. SLBN-146 TaxID=2768457 RepID=UPI00114D7020|nr:hypothetical protein [Microbacterium sp. SLBN-146]TQJ31945.1 hypothetical protein FBY39_2434 [Microbacterium sp. SLBN-146]
MNLITHGASTITPTEILGYTSERESRNIIHAILGRSNPDVTLRPAALRTGTLIMGFHGANSEADSASAEALHATGGVFTVLSPDRGTIEMSYVAAGRITRELEDETRDAWVLRVDFQEVAP